MNLFVNHCDWPRIAEKPECNRVFAFLDVVESPGGLVFQERWTDTVVEMSCLIRESEV